MVAIKNLAILLSAAAAVRAAPLEQRATEGTAITTLSQLLDSVTGDVADFSGLWKALTEGTNPHEAHPVKRADTTNESSNPIVNLIGSIVNGFSTQVTNTAQSLYDQGLSTDAGRMYTALDALDRVVDSTAGFIGTTLSPVTFGLSQDILDVAAGPIVQGINHGLFSLVSLVVGGGMDMITGNTEAQNSLNNILANSQSIADKLGGGGVDTSPISSGIEAVQNAIGGGQ